MGLGTWQAVAHICSRLCKHISKYNG